MFINSKLINTYSWIIIKLFFGFIFNLILLVVEKVEPYPLIIYYIYIYIYTWDLRRISTKGDYMHL